MLSNTCKYGIRAVVYLALKSNGVDKIGIKQIAGELDIPTPFLGKILQLLAKNKLLNSNKGPHGGFSLAKKPKDITLLDVIQIIDGLDFFDTCMVGLKICQGDEDLKKHCPVHEKSHEVRESIVEMFKGFSIEKVAQDIEEVNKKLKLNLLA